METTPSDFLSGGFLVPRTVDRAPRLGTELLPASLVSASACIAPFAPDTLCIEWTGDTREQRLIVDHTK